LFKPPPSIRELLSLKMLNAIREFWEVKGEEETLELVLDAAKTGIGYRDVAARRKAAQKGRLSGRGLRASNCRSVGQRESSSRSRRMAGSS
jgi:hypothetical protein